MLKCAHWTSLSAFALALFAVDANAIEINPRGRMHLDYAFHDTDERELGDKFIVRRARMGLSGKITDDWSFQIEYDFAEDGSAARDVFLRYGGWQGGNFTIGHFKVPFSLEELTSSNSITFIERSLPTTTFAQSRRLGLGLAGGGDNWHYAVMGFGQPSGADVRGTDSSDEGLGVGGRLVFNPVRGANGLLHLGLAVTTEEPADSEAESVRFRTRPESRPTGVRLVDTGNLGNVDQITRFGGEIAWQTGPFSIQGEWMQTDVSRKEGAPAVDFSGWYASASYVLTGESRGYRGGVFRGVSPERESGAWEVAVRASHVDLNDGLVIGGEESNYTLGINWYAHSNIRFMANLVRVDTERDFVLVGEDESETVVTVTDKPTVLLMRMQVSF